MDFLHNTIGVFAASYVGLALSREKIPQNDGLKQQSRNTKQKHVS